MSRNHFWKRICSSSLDLFSSRNFTKLLKRNKKVCWYFSCFAYIRFFVGTLAPTTLFSQRANLFFNVKLTVCLLGKLELSVNIFVWFALVFCYQNCSDLLWEKIVPVIEKTFWNSRLKAENLQNFWDHLNNLFKQWKVRTISGNRMFF